MCTSCKKVVVDSLILFSCAKMVGYFVVFCGRFVSTGVNKLPDTRIRFILIVYLPQLSPASLSVRCFCFIRKRISMIAKFYGSECELMHLSILQGWNGNY